MELKKFHGIRNTTSPERLKLGELVSATDVDVDDTGRVVSRQGTTVISATAAHSLYATPSNAFLVEGSTLKVLENDLSRTAVKLLTTSAAVSYAAVGDTVFYSNGVDTGRLIGRTWGEWGIAPPVGQPTASVDGLGALPAGRYMYALTYLRKDGEESGTDLAGAVDVPANGRITFTSTQVSTNSEIDGKILYLSSPNGEELYRATSMGNAAGYMVVGRVPTGPLLTTQFAQNAPAGTLVRWHSGMVAVVSGGTVWLSDPHNAELFRLGINFLRFPGKVVVFESVNSGFYVATEDAGSAKEGGGTWYVEGRKIDEFKARQLSDHGAIAGTGTSTLAGYFERSTDSGDEPHGAGPAAIWSSRHGVCVGFEGGEMRNLTENMYSFPSAVGGAAFVRQVRGYNQYVAVLRGAGSLNNAA